MHTAVSEPTTAPELDLTPDLPAQTTKDAPSSSPTSNKGTQVLAFLKAHSPLEEQKDPADRPLFDATVLKAVESGEPLHMVLPAFPFKSPNNIDKTLGVLPDLGEEIALARLESITAELERKFERPATLSIVSDGLVYNDLLGVSEDKVWNYGTRLRELAEIKYPHIKFARLHHLVEMQAAKDVEEYCLVAGSQRDKLIAEYLPKDFDVKAHLKSNVSALMTYRGYCKFLLTDLALAHKDLSKSKAKKENEAIAKKMIARGTAFSNAVEARYPSAIRLSIHASKNPKKLPIAIFPGDNAFITPWHAACGHNLDGSVTIAHQDELAAKDEYELVHKDGKPSHFQEKSELLDCAGVEVEVMPCFPTGITIEPKETEGKVPVTELDVEKVKALAELNAPVVLKGFVVPEEDDKLKIVDVGKEIEADILIAKESEIDDDGVVAVLNQNMEASLKIEGELIVDSDEKVVKKERTFESDSDTDVEEDVEWAQADMGLQRGYLAF